MPAPESSGVAGCHEPRVKNARRSSSQCSCSRSQKSMSQWLDLAREPRGRFWIDRYIRCERSNPVADVRGSDVVSLPLRRGELKVTGDFRRTINCGPLRNKRRPAQANAIVRRRGESGAGADIFDTRGRCVARAVEREKLTACWAERRLAKGEFCMSSVARSSCQFLAVS